MKETARLSLQEQGAYFMIMKEYWNNGGPIEDDKTRIYRSCGAQSRSEKESVNLILGTYFLHENGMYKHTRIDRELSDAYENKEKNRKRTEKATAARKKTTSNVTTNVTSTPSPSPSPILSEDKSSSSSNSDLFGKSEKPKKIKRNITAWEKIHGKLSPENLTPFAEKHHLTDSDMNLLLDKFRNKCLAKDFKYVDFYAAFRAWDWTNEIVRLNNKPKTKTTGDDEWNRIMGV